MRKHAVIAALALVSALAIPHQVQAKAAPGIIVCDRQGCRPETPPDARPARASRERNAVRTARHSGRSRETNQRPSLGESDARIVAHPEGCPWRLFCGCGVAARVFSPGTRFVTYGGRRLNLWRAAEWLHFPRTSPAPGMVAARDGHVFLIEAVHSDGTVTAYDPNSGGHLTRVHRIGLGGYRVVDPRAGQRLARN